MSLPTTSNILGLDFAFNGQPFVQVAAKTAISFDGMDIADQGQPIGWGIGGGSGGGGAAPTTRPQVFVCT